MNRLIKFLFLLCLFSIALGPFGALPIEILSVNLYLTDIIVAFLSLFWLINISSLCAIVKKDKLMHFFLIFVMSAFLSFLLAPISLSPAQKLVSFLYLVRVFSYSSIYFTAFYLTKNNLLKENKIIKYLICVGVALSIIGWLQYLFYPDLRNLFYLGWDPHFKRIFSTYFDPNFLGLILVLTLIILFSKQIFPKAFTWFSRIGVFVTLMFTYSRSSYLALIAAALFYSIIKKKYIITFLVLGMVVLSALVLPRPFGEGVKLERLFSLEQRIQNWQSAVSLWSQYPFLGVGFNTLRYINRPMVFSIVDNSLPNHALGGFDNSFLFVGTTTGILGLMAYVLFLFQCFKKGNMLFKASLIAAVVHSFFLNSLFFPWVMVWIWILLGVDPSPVSDAGSG